VPLIGNLEALDMEQRLSSQSSGRAEQRMSDSLSQSSSHTSMIGGTVLYDQHLTEHALIRKQAHLNGLKSEIILLGLVFVSLFLSTLCCQGIIKGF
jgi:hypothetical protein